MSLHVYGTQRTAGAEVLAGSTAYALLLIHHRDKQSLFARYLIVVSIQPSSPVTVNALHQRHHLYGLCRTLACTQAASLPVTHGNAEIAIPHSVTHLYGSACLHGYRLYGTSGGTPGCNGCTRGDSSHAHN